MFFPRKTSVVLAFSALSALAVAVGCSHEEESVETGTGDLTGGGQLQDLVISQVYGGGGNNGAKYTTDFIELFNQGDHDVDLAGVQLQYVSAGVSFTKAKNYLVLPAGTPKLAAGHYFLIQVATGAATGATPAGVPLTDVDYVATQPLELISMSKESGKLALVAAGADALEGCGAPGAACDATKYIDLVGYGPNASQFRGAAPVPALTTGTAAVRRFGGCAHSQDNSQDFEALEPLPRNGKTAASPMCNTVDASAPPPPPPVIDGGADGSTKSDAGKSDGGTKADAGPKPPKSDAGKADSGTHTKDAGKGTTAGDDDDDDTVDPGDGDDDDDDVDASKKKTGTKPTKTLGTNNAAPTPTFPATSPSCTTASGPASSFSGLGAIFGLALAGTALRRRR